MINDGERGNIDYGKGVETWPVRVDKPTTPKANISDHFDGEPIGYGLIRDARPSDYLIPSLALADNNPEENTDPDVYPRMSPLNPFEPEVYQEGRQQFWPQKDPRLTFPEKVKKM